MRVQKSARPDQAGVQNRRGQEEPQTAKALRRHIQMGSLEKESLLEEELQIHRAVQSEAQSHQRYCWVSNSCLS